MTLPQIMERLLRSRLYREPVTVVTEDGRRRLVLVRDLRHEGARSLVLVATGTGPRTETAIPLAAITSVTPADHRRPAKETVA